MIEQWKKVPGYENLYIVSNLGLVVSLSKWVDTGIGFMHHKQKPIKQYYGGGYLRVALYKNGIKSQFSVHRIVAMAFVENENNKPEVNHINGDKLDNRAVNLEWCTSKENKEHSKNVLKRQGCNKKLVVNTQNGIFYESAKDANHSYGKKIHLSYFRTILRNQNTNKTNFIYA